MKSYNELIQWLMDGDPAIVYRTRTELLGESGDQVMALQEALPDLEGYIKAYFSYRNSETGLWAEGIYLPKWTSTHYTMLELMRMRCPGEYPPYQESARILLDGEWGPDNKFWKGRAPDICMVGMLGSIVCHGHITDKGIDHIMDYILGHIQPDGGFNCSWERSQVSSVHTTLTVLEFFLDYENKGYKYRLEEAMAAAIRAEAWFMERHIYQQRSKGEPVHKRVTNLPYPTRYKFDILKALEYFVDRGRPYHEGMRPALDLLFGKRLKSGAWPSTGNHGREKYFDIKDEGKDHRINTLRGLKVLNAYGKYV